MFNFLSKFKQANHIEPATTRTRNKITKIASEENICSLIKSGEIIKVDKNQTFLLSVNNCSICPGKYIAPMVCYFSDGTRTVIDPDEAKRRKFIKDLVLALYDTTIYSSIEAAQNKLKIS